METINDVLHFLNYLDSVADLENHEYSNSYTYMCNYF